MLLLQLLHSLLLPLPLLLVQALQILSPLVFLQHLVALELLVPLSIIVLQVLGGLGDKPVGGKLVIKNWIGCNNNNNIKTPENRSLHLSLKDLTVEISNSRSFASNVF